MSDTPPNRFAQTLDAIRADGLFKAERVITSPQDAEIELEGGRRVLNFCANNYLGLADDPSVIAAAKGRSTRTASAWPRCASSAAPRTCTSSWRRRSPPFSDRGRDP